MPAGFGQSKESKLKNTDEYRTDGVRRSKKRKKSMKVAKEMKQALGGRKDGVDFQPHLHKGKWQIAQEKELERHKDEPVVIPPAHKRSTVSDEELKRMVKERFSGATTDEIARKYAVSINYIDTAIQRKFMSSTRGRTMLRDILLENALASGMHFQTKIPELTGMQAAVSTGIMTGRLIDLEKAGRELSAEDEIDFSQLDKLSETMDDIAKMVELPNIETAAALEEDSSD